MNSINFNQIGGFPFSTNILGRMQEAYSVFSALGSIVGDKTIISGCVTTGSNVSPGVVFVNGEVFEFKGGAVQSKVIIKEDTEGLVFQNLNTYQVIKKRYVTFGTGVGAIDWVDFKRGFETKNIPSDLNDRLALIEKKLTIFQPGGAVFPWFKPVADIPPGFQPVADIKGRMIIGYDPSQTEFNAIGKQGGAKNKTLSIAELPELEFETTLPSNSNGTPGTGGIMFNGAHNNNVTLKTNKIGGKQAFSMLNPYIIAEYIEFIG